MESRLVDATEVGMTAGDSLTMDHGVGDPYGGSRCWSRAQTTSPGRRETVRDHGVEVMGFEPTASSMRPKRSSQLSYTPVMGRLIVAEDATAPRPRPGPTG